MAHLIDKDAVVAEIERRMDENSGKQTLPQYFGMVEEDLNILSFIDTLEVKDVWKDNFELPQENVPIIACCIGGTLVIQGIFKIINKGYKSETYRISSYGWDVVKKWAYMKDLFPYRSHEIPIYFENELVEGDKHHNRELESHKAWEESLLYADRIRGSF